MVVWILKEMGVSLPLAWETVLNEATGVVENLDAPLLIRFWLPFGHVQPAPDQTDNVPPLMNEP